VGQKPASGRGKAGVLRIALHDEVWIAKPFTEEVQVLRDLDWAVKPGEARQF